MKVLALCMLCSLAAPAIALAEGTAGEVSPIVGFTEVVASKLESAQSRLDGADFVELQDGTEGKRFAGRNFSCTMGNYAYLVKANYDHSGAAEFVVRRSGSTLSIAYESLGRASPVRSTALVLCLPVQITLASSFVGGAE
jgi:hypothetical protein